MRHYISVGLYNLRQGGPEDVRPDAIKVNLEIDGPSAIEPFGLPAISIMPPGVADLQKPVLHETIKLVILHNRCEVTFGDGRRIFYGPVLSDESKRRYGMFMQVVGLAGRVDVPVLERLSGPRSVPGTP